MSYDRSTPPPQWGQSLGANLVDAGSEVYYLVPRPENSRQDVLVWHWHVPDPKIGEPRWLCQATPLHKILVREPLTLDPSLACEDGCPNHGWIREGKWVSV